MKWCSWQWLQGNCMRQQIVNNAVIEVILAFLITRFFALLCIKISKKSDV